VGRNEGKHKVVSFQHLLFLLRLYCDDLSVLSLYDPHIATDLPILRRSIDLFAADEILLGDKDQGLLNPVSVAQSLGNSVLAGGAGAQHSEPEEFLQDSLSR